jgi:8-oxo-dGTP pyrophosphatase MutT (NUDIX family)
MMELPNLGGDDMLAQALIVRDGRFLMVRQHKHDRRFWNFPGGHVEEDETPEQACIREVKEETGYDVALGSLLCRIQSKYTFLAEITGGEFTLEPWLVDFAWAAVDDEEKWDAKTSEVLRIYGEYADLPRPFSESTRSAMAVLKEESILLVKQTWRGSTFWTLPGGRIEPGEEAEAAAVREAKEETGLETEAVRLVCQYRHPRLGGGMYYCFLGKVVGGVCRLGGDPELMPDEQELRELKWFPFEEAEQFVEIGRILDYLGNRRG